VMSASFFLVLSFNSSVAVSVSLDLTIDNPPAVYGAHGWLGMVANPFTRIVSFTHAPQANTTSANFFAVASFTNVRMVNLDPGTILTLGFASNSYFIEDANPASQVIFQRLSFGS